VTNPTIGFTGNGTVSTQTGEKKFGTASMLVGGTSGNDYIENTSGDYAFWPSGTGAFTIEWWQYIPSAVSGSQYMEFCGNEETGGGLALRFGRNYGSNTINAFNIFARGQADMEYWNVTWTRDTWQYVSLTRSGTNLFFHVDGVSLSASGGSGGGTRNFVATSGLNKFRLGNCGDTGLRGVYIDDFRVSNATARYSSSNYTPPTAEGILETGTTLLLNLNGSNGGTSFPNKTSN
jgi:hypothetical protein